MTTDKGPLQPEDYAEPRCLLCDEPYGAEKIKTVPQRRIIEKMDEYMGRKDFGGAERHLRYWLEEARLGGDGRGQLLIFNELIGFYRKTGEREKAFESAEKALSLIDELSLEGSRSAATAYINAATAYNAFGENERALPLFRKAQAIYETDGATDHQLKGGLYNNMGLTYAALGMFGDAFESYEKALSVMEDVPDGKPEQAITYLNMADAVEAGEGMETGERKIFGYLDRACDLLNDEAAPRNRYYAFVCEKCAPVFEHYGYFAAAGELGRRAEEIYAGD